MQACLALFLSLALFTFKPHLEGNFCLDKVPMVPQQVKMYTRVILSLHLSLNLGQTKVRHHSFHMRFTEIYMDSQLAMFFFVIMQNKCIIVI